MAGGDAALGFDMVTRHRRDAKFLVGDPCGFDLEFGRFFGEHETEFHSVRGGFSGRGVVDLKGDFRACWNLSGDALRIDMGAVAGCVNSPECFGSSGDFCGFALFVDLKDDVVNDFSGCGDDFIRADPAILWEVCFDDIHLVRHGA